MRTVSSHYSCLGTTNAVASTLLDLPLGCAKLVCFCYKFISLMPDGSFARKESSLMEYVKLVTDARLC